MVNFTVSEKLWRDYSMSKAKEKFIERFQDFDDKDKQAISFYMSLYGMYKHDFVILRERLGIPLKRKFSKAQHIKSLMTQYYPAFIEEIRNIPESKYKRLLEEESKVYNKKCLDNFDALLISPHILARVI